MADTSKHMDEKPQSWATGILICLVLSIASSTPAQPFGRTVVATFATSEESSALEVAAEIEAQLLARRVPVISMHDARDRFSATSREPQDPTRSDLDALAKEAKQAVEHVAFGRAAAAEKGVREIMGLAERSLETLNRETQHARQLLDACLALVRSSLHEGRRQDAVEQAMSCRRLVPDLLPSSSAHPAIVVGVLAEADDELRRMRIGSITVQHAPPRSCAVYFNGRQLGMTPFALDRAAVGSYRVQVECGDKRAGRVHVVQLGDQPVQLEVDTAFDEAC